MRNIVPILLDQKVTIKDKIRYVQYRYMAFLLNIFFSIYMVILGLACFYYQKNRKDYGNAALLILIQSNPDFLAVRVRAGKISPPVTYEFGSITKKWSDSSLV
jgi:hypothetical protein